mgnify:CR=1 FL=1
MDAVAEAAACFPIQGTIRSIEAFGSGHIHDTYRLTTSEASYLIQRLNTDIFSQPASIFWNQKLLKPLIDQELIVEGLHTIQGEPGLEIDGNLWRVQTFIDQVYGPLKANSEKEVSEVAKGFALFDIACLALNPNQFKEVIPDFHKLSWRLQQFEEALALASEERFEKAVGLIQKVHSHKWIDDQVNDLWERGLPVRVCHNDTKADNVLLKKDNEEFQFVIDLDTVGPGALLYDFGDLMRTMLSATGESEPNADDINLNQTYFHSMAKAYKRVMWESITELEKSSLVFGGIYMTFMMGVRFLTDYLNGDVYYKVSFENENLVRARNQLTLLEELNKKRVPLEKILKEI